jgi:hypothetical protein
MGHGGLFGKQVIAGHREIATLLSTPRRPWMADKPRRPAERITGSPHAVCRTGVMALIVLLACREHRSHTWRDPVQCGGQRVHGEDRSASTHGDTRHAPRTINQLQGTAEGALEHWSSAEEPRIISRCPYEHVSRFPCVSRGVQATGRLRALCCALALGKLMGPPTKPGSTRTRGRSPGLPRTRRQARPAPRYAILGLRG